jgi:hypothetical protein
MRYIMKDRALLSLVLVAFLASVLVFSQFVYSEEEKSFVPDKELCGKMIRFGKQAYQRGKYLDAKEYFRRAVQADPMSSMAWRYYDMAAVFALAEKVEKNSDLIAPDRSVRQEGPADSAAKAAPHAPPAPPAPKAGHHTAEEEEEGC